ncbi:uncharacterized protein LOC116350700 [Contarinia nasturtii]|uniref:uncharacterized protein LOC116350700 n=1 Tax=Contarinia nasturtii TaxID=265458 RepID=UPI0012D4446C|nr:uncharacterized protein LOC116350700 [Contarinia nasturtii]
MSFSGKVVLITGASSGIGADAARHLASKGASVSIVGRNEKRLNAVAEEIIKAGHPTPLAIVADVTKDVERIVDETIKKFGKLDVLVNNAGIVAQDNVVDIELSGFDRIFNTNLKSVIMLSKLCVPHLEKTRGNIVNVSSVAGLKCIQNVLSYSMSKAALDQFTKCSALDLAPKHIRVNSINPAAIETPIFQVGDLSKELIDRVRDDCISKYPVKRIGDVSDTSSAIAYLADENAASFLTGILLTIDGGYMLV